MELGFEVYIVNHFFFFFEIIYIVNFNTCNETWVSIFWQKYTRASEKYEMGVINWRNKFCFPRSLFLFWSELLKKDPCTSLIWKIWKSVCKNDLIQPKKFKHYTTLESISFPKINLYSTISSKKKKPFIPLVVYFSIV